MRKLRHLVVLNMVDRRLLATASIRLALVALAIRWLGFRWVVTRMPIARRIRRDSDVHACAVHYATWIEVAARHLPIRTRCLARSVALHWWLRSEGADSELRIGVAKRGRELAAHAWVEVAGAPVHETMVELAPFTPLQHVGSWRREPYGQIGVPMAMSCGQSEEMQRCMTSTGYRK